MRTAQVVTMRAAAVVTALGCLAWAGAASAEKLADVIPGLYGGNGIVLRNPPGNHTPIFTAPDNDELNEINTIIASNLAPLSVGSAVASFEFDPTTATFKRTTESLGPIVADLGTTIGRSKLHLGFSFTQANYKQLGGEDLDDFAVTFDHLDLCGNASAFRGFPPSAANNYCQGTPPVPGSGQPTPGDPPFEVDGIFTNLDIELEQNIALLFANYGFTDHLEAGILLPFVQSSIKVKAKANIIRNFPNSNAVHNFCTTGDQAADRFGCNDPVLQRDLADDSGSASSFGIGDIQLRGKWQFWESGEIAPDMALLGKITVPSGDEDNFQGTGEAEFSFFGAFSRQYFGFLTPHINVGFEFTTGPKQLNNFRYTVGAEARAHETVTVIVDFLGRRELWLDGFADHLWDFSAGLKWNAFRTFNLFGNAIIPINKDAGLRTNVTWTLGFEYTF